VMNDDIMHDGSIDKELGFSLFWKLHGNTCITNGLIKKEVSIVNKHSIGSCIERDDTCQFIVVLVWPSICWFL
jgi:hypothetical protein